MKNPAPLISIGTLAAATGLTVATVRFYEEQGLIPAAERRPSGHRAYGQATVLRLKAIRALREFQMPLERVKVVMSHLFNEVEHDHRVIVAELATQLEQLRLQVASLTQFEASLSSIVATCSDSCATGPAPSCSMLSDLVGDPCACCT